MKENSIITTSPAKPTQQKYLSLLLSLLQNISVEPMLFFYSGAFTIYGSVSGVGMYWKICAQEFSNDSSVNCRNMSAAGPVVEKVVQQVSASWLIYNAVAQILPLVFIVPIYGAVSDRYGRKWNIVISIAGLIAFGLIHVLQFTFVTWPLFLFPLVGFFISLTGFVGSGMSAAFAYVCDETSDKDFLTYRMSFMSVCSNLSDIIFGLFAAFTMKHLSYAQGMLIPISLWTAAFLYSLFFLHQVPPKEMAEFKLRNRKGKGRSTRDKGQSTKYKVQQNKRYKAVQIQQVTENNNCCNSKSADNVEISTGKSEEAETLENGFGCADMANVLREIVIGTIQAISKRREDRKRLYLWVTVVAFIVLNSCKLGLIAVQGLFLMRSPISFDISDFALYGVFNEIVSTLGTISGTFIMKSWLNFHESSMLLAALVSSILKCVCLGFSNSRTMVYIAAALGAFGGLTMTMCKSLTTQFVDKDEIGKVFALFQVAMDLSIIVSFMGFSALYMATVTYYAGTVFLVISAMASFALVLFLFVHIDYRRYRLAIANRKPVVESLDEVNL